MRTDLTIHSSSGCRPAVRAALAVLVSLIAVPAAWGARAPTADVAGVLKSRRGDARTEEQVLDELRRLGSGAVPALFEIAAKGPDTLFSGVAEGEDLAKAWWGGDPSVFPELAYEALAGMPPKKVVPVLEHLCSGEEDLTTWISACRVLGRLGSSAGIPLWLQVASGIGEPRVGFPSVRRPLVESLSSMLRNDGASAGVLEREMNDLDVGTLRIVLESIGRSESPEGVRLLTIMTGRGSDLDLTIVEEIPRLYARMPWRILWEPHTDLRAFLEAEDWRLRRAAAVGVARIRDRESFPAVIRLLEDPSPLVRETARWALGALAGTQLVLDAEGLERFYAERVAWWGENRTRLSRELRADDLGTVASAAREIAGVRLFREEAARMLGGALRFDRPETAVVICAALEKLESLVPVAELSEMLASQDDPARLAAWRALTALTGEDLPPELEAWQGFVLHGRR